MIGWRWSFFGQLPVVILATILCAVSLPDSHPTSTNKTTLPEYESPSNKTKWAHLTRIDFKGCLFFTALILSLLTPLELGGVHFPWTHPLIITLFLSSLILLYLFIHTERHAAEPIIPLAIFHQRDAVLSYLVMGTQMAAQVGVMYSVPLYFQVTARTSNAEAGAHLFPAVAGNAVGGLLSGLWIKRSGRYKSLCISATLAGCASYALLMLRWHGETNWLESLYIVPGGFGAGVAQSALFIALQVVVDAEHMAPAVSMMYLSTNVASMVGIASAHAVMQHFLGQSLARRLLDLGLGAKEREEVMGRAVSDLGYVADTHGPLRTAIVGSYVDGFWWSHGKLVFVLKFARF